MAGEIGGILTELNGILEKRATAAVDKNSGGYDGTNVLEGDANATQGAGSPAKSQQDNKSPRDRALQDELPMKTQMDDGQKSIAYNMGQGKAPSNETKSVDGFNSGNPDDQVEGEYAKHDAEKQTSKMANNILRGLYASMMQTPGHPKAAGAQSADAILQQLIKAELHKSAMEMSAEELAKKWPGMSSEEKDKYREMHPDLVEKAMAMVNSSDGDYGGEKEAGYMTPDQLAEYMHYKQAGAQAALQFIQQLQGGHQKSAAEQEYQHSWAAGRQAAERDMQKVAAAHQAGQQAAQLAQMRKQAQLQAQMQYEQQLALQKQAQAQQLQDAQFMHPAQQMQMQASAYQQMLKNAADAGMNPDVLHQVLTDMHRAAQAAPSGGSPRPFGARGHVKSAVDVAPLYPVLSGLLDEGTITSEEKEAILNYLAGVEDLSEDALRGAMADVGNPEAVLKRILAGDVQQHQRNTHKADSPKPSMPATQPSPSAETAEETRTVSEGGAEPNIPGSVTPVPGDQALQELIVEAALRNTLKKLSPDRYSNL